MTDTLSHITVAQVLAAAAMVYAVFRFGGRVWRWAVRAVHFVDKLEVIERAVMANGGASMRDAVDRLEAGQTETNRAVAETNTRVEQVATTQASLAASHEQLVDEVGQLRQLLTPAVPVGAADDAKGGNP